MRGNEHGWSSNLRRGLVAAAWLMPALAGAAPAVEAVLPPRFHVAESVKPRFLDLLALSPTFRAQCQRIADAEVRVVIEVGFPWEFDRKINALSTLVRDDGGRLAFVRVRLSHGGSWSVLIPHELEHVVEQLDGVNLAAIAAERNGKAWRVNGRAYETRRAHDAGHAVDREYRKRAPVERLALNATTDVRQP
jgi:hypothetical protein